MEHNSNKTDQQLSRSLLLMVIGFFIVLVGIHFTGYKRVNSEELTQISAGWRMHQEGQEDVLLLDEEGYQAARFSNYVTIKNRLTQEVLDKGNLVFYLKDASALVYFDQASIYSFGSIDKRSAVSFLGSQGANWHIVRIPKYAVAGDEVRFTIKPNNPAASRSLPYVYAEKGHDFSMFLLYKNMFSLISLMFLLGFGLMAIAFYRLYKNQYKLHQSIEDFGFFILILVLWLAAENIWIKLLFFDQREVLQALVFYGKNMLFIPFAYIFVHTEAFPYKKQMELLISTSWIYIIVHTLMYMGLEANWDLYPKWNMLIKFLMVLYSGLFSTRYYLKSRDKDILDILLFGYFYMAFYLFGQGLDGVLRERYSHSALELVAITGVTLFLVDNIRTAMDSYNENLEAERYKKMSITDAMTGLGNKNLFLKKLKEVQLAEGLALIALDINDLKLVNDKKGHLTGDRMIVATADLIDEVFGEGFEKFRIGGDEFFVLSRGKTESELEELLWRFNDKAREHNETEELKINVASGLAVYNARLDETIKDLMDRADENMYIRKITMKM